MRDPVEIRRFIRRAEEGIQRPPLFEASDGHTYVLKLDTHERGFPAAEILGAHLAGPLDVQAPAFELLTVPDALLELTRSLGEAGHTEFADSWARLGQRVFGSRYLEGVVDKWRSLLRPRLEGGDAFLVRLLILDAFIENMDRSAAHNPNLLVANGRLFAIDHGQGFPTVHGARSGFAYNYGSHIAWPVLLERPELLDEALEPLLALSDASIDAAIATVPDAWWVEPGHAAATRAALIRRRERVPEEIRGMLERR